MMPKSVKGRRRSKPVSRIRWHDASADRQLFLTSGRRTSTPSPSPSHCRLELEGRTATWRLSGRSSRCK